MSTLRTYRVGMLMDKGGRTFVLVGAMCRAHALQVARTLYKGWHPTGEIEEMRCLDSLSYSG